MLRRSCTVFCWPLNSTVNPEYAPVSHCFSTLCELRGAKVEIESIWVAGFSSTVCMFWVYSDIIQAAFSNDSRSQIRACIRQELNNAVQNAQQSPDDATYWRSLQRWFSWVIRFNLAVFAAWSACYLSTFKATVSFGTQILKCLICIFGLMVPPLSTKIRTTSTYCPHKSTNWVLSVLLGISRRVVMEKEHRTQSTAAWSGWQTVDWMLELTFLPLKTYSRFFPTWPSCIIPYTITSTWVESTGMISCQSTTVMREKLWRLERSSFSTFWIPRCFKDRLFTSSICMMIV